MPKEEQIGYLFPLDKYHSNWEEFDYQSPLALVKDLGNRYYKENSRRGYYAWDSVKESGYLPENALNSEVRGEIYSFNMKYLETIYKECKEKGAQLVLTRVPLPCDNYIVEEMNTVQDWADEHEVPFINYMKMTDEIGIDWKQDSLDGGNHLNVYGAEKISRHLAEYLKKEYLK